MNINVFIINFNHKIDRKSINKDHKSISFKMQIQHTEEGINTRITFPNNGNVNFSEK